MASRVIGLIAALLIFLGVIAAFDDKDNVRAVQDLALATTTTGAPEVRLASIAEWDASPLVMPKAIPPGWKLTYAGILPADESKEGCDQVELDYEDPADPNEGFLYLYEFPNACRKPFEKGIPFSAGRYRGFSRYSQEEGVVVQLTIDATTLQATTDLTLDELHEVLDEFVPLDVIAASAASGGRP